MTQASLAAVPNMMYGYGDTKTHYQATVDLVEVCSSHQRSLPVLCRQGSICIVVLMSSHSSMIALSGDLWKERLWADVED